MGNKCRRKRIELFKENREKRILLKEDMEEKRQRILRIVLVFNLATFVNTKIWDINLYKFFLYENAQESTSKKFWEFATLLVIKLHRFLLNKKGGVLSTNHRHLLCNLKSGGYAMWNTEANHNYKNFISGPEYDA